jgi:broad specificity phosphatase PhoE
MRVTAGCAAGTLFLVRHGRTAENQKSYVGWGNPPLDPTGVQQAATLVTTLRGERIDGVYSSPLVRAIQTARPLAAAHRLEIGIRSALREINYGDYEGGCKETTRLVLRTRHRYEPMPLGESLFDLYRRVREFSDEVAGLLRNGQRVVVVGHFWSNRMLVGCLGDVPFDAIVDAPLYKPGNGSILEVICRHAPQGVSVRAALRSQAEELS